MNHEISHSNSASGMTTMGAHFSHPKVSRIFGRAKKNPKDPNIATSHGSLGTQKGSVLEGKWDPGYFREI